MWKLAKHLYSTIPFTKNFKKFDLIGTTLSCQCNCVGVFYFLSLFFFKFYFFTLQYCIGFAIHWHESTTGVHALPTLNPPPTTLPYHLSGSSQCTSPKHPVSCIEPRLAICFLHDSIHVSMHSPKSSHPLPLPQSPKVCSLHLCLFCCLAYRVIITIFLNSIYMC